MAGKEAVNMLRAAAQKWSSFQWDTSGWAAVATQHKDAREASLSTRKQLAENTKQFKRSVKTVEAAGGNLNGEASEENAQAAAKAIESLSKLSRVTVKAYQG